MKRRKKSVKTKQNPGASSRERSEWRLSCVTQQSFPLIRLCACQSICGWTISLHSVQVLQHGTSLWRKDVVNRVCYTALRISPSSIQGQTPRQANSNTESRGGRQIMSSRLSFELTCTTHRLCNKVLSLSLSLSLQGCMQERRKSRKLSWVPAEPNCRKRSVEDKTSKSRGQLKGGKWGKSMFCVNQQSLFPLFSELLSMHLRPVSRISDLCGL